MRTGRVLVRLVRVDLLERVRRRSFLVTVGAMVCLGCLAVPSVDSGAITVNLGNLRGIYNSAWIGSMIALLSSTMLSLAGFYLVKNGIARDRETGVGQIIATTPLGGFTYTVGKATGNFVFLVAIVTVVALAAGGMQVLRGAVRHMVVRRARQRRGPARLHRLRAGGSRYRVAIHLPGGRGSTAGARLHRTSTKGVLRLLAGGLSVKPRLPYVRDSHRAELAKRLRYLWTFELFDAALFPGLVLAVRLLTGEPMGAYAWAGAGLVSWMLLQGSVYWWLRLRTLRLASALPVG